MLDLDVSSMTPSFVLAVVGVVWYNVLWVISLLGCFAG